MAEASEPKKETVRITLPPVVETPPRLGGRYCSNQSSVAATRLRGLHRAPLVPKPGNVPIPRPPVSQNPLPAPSARLCLYRTSLVRRHRQFHRLFRQLPKHLCLGRLEQRQARPGRRHGRHGHRQLLWPRKRRASVSCPIRQSQRERGCQNSAAHYRDGDTGYSANRARNNRPRGTAAGHRKHSDLALLGIGLSVSRHFDH